MLPDVMFGCLHQALKGGVPAEGTSCLWNLSALGGPGRADGDPAETVNAKVFTIMSFHAGGTGARPGKDGLSATAFPSGVRNVPVEVNETISPIVIWKKEYRQDSGGAGEFRGGLGQVMEVGTLDHAPFAISAYYDRIDHPPRGRDGGQNGMAGPGGPRLGQDAARHGPADRAAQGPPDHRHAGARRARQSAPAGGSPRWPTTCARASSRPRRRGRDYGVGRERTGLGRRGRDGEAAGEARRMTPKQPCHRLNGRQRQCAVSAGLPTGMEG
jgi:hypothetical protein